VLVSGCVGFCIQVCVYVSEVDYVNGYVNGCVNEVNYVAVSVCLCLCPWCCIVLQRVVMCCSVLQCGAVYGLATISRLLKIISLFCRIKSLL